MKTYENLKSCGDGSNWLFDIMKNDIACILTAVQCLTVISYVDKAPRPSISNVIWMLPSDTGMSAVTPLGPGARKVLAK